MPVRSVPRDLSLQVKAKPLGSAGEQLSTAGSLCQATEGVLGHYILLLLLLHSPGCPVPGEQLVGGLMLVNLPSKIPPDCRILALSPSTTAQRGASGLKCS